VKFFQNSHSPKLEHTNEQMKRTFFVV